MTPDARASWPIPPSWDFFETTRLLRLGTRDPTLRREPDGLWRATRTPDGPATVRLTLGDALIADAWGPGAESALAGVPQWVGLDEPVWSFPAHPVVDRIAREHAGLRLTNTGDPYDAGLAAIAQQLVTWQEAAAAWRGLCERLGEPAPGPVDLHLPPTPRAIRAAGTAPLQAVGVGPKQARAMIEWSLAAHAVRRVVDLPTDAASALLQAVPGVGPWTAALVLGGRLGRPEPLPTGDVHLPHTVAWALAGEPRGTDARMVELLAPFEGQATRVVRLLLAARIEAPRRGPRQAIRWG